MAVDNTHRSSVDSDGQEALAVEADDVTHKLVTLRADPVTHELLVAATLTNPATGATNIQDTGNMQPSPLNSGQTFTGQWTYVGASPAILNFYIGEYATTPVTPTAPTFTIEWSVDGVNLDTSVFGSSAQTMTLFPPSAQLPNGAYVLFNYTTSILRPYYRVVTTAGSANQTAVFALQLIQAFPFTGSYVPLSGNTGSLALVTTPPPDFSLSTTFTSGEQTLTQLGGLDGYAGWEAFFIGTFSSGTNIVFEGTTDGTNWFSIDGRLRPGLTQFSSITGTIGGPGAYDGVVGSVQGIRVRVVSFAGGDNITCTLRISYAQSTEFGIDQIVACTKVRTQQIAVPTTVVQLDSPPLTQRRSVEVYSLAGNPNNCTVWVGFSNSTTPANGRGLSNGESWRLDITEAVQVWAVASTNATVSLTEIAQ